MSGRLVLGFKRMMLKGGVGGGATMATMATMVNKLCSAKSAEKLYDSKLIEV